MRTIRALSALTLLAISAWPTPATGAAPAGGGPDVEVLENELYRLEFDSAHGRLLRFLDKAGGVDLRPPEALAGNFRLIVPVPDEPRNFVEGRDQPLSQVRRGQDSLVLVWNGPLTDAGGRRHDLDVTMTVSLEQEAAVFRLALVNRGEHRVQEAWYPRIGGLLNFGPSDASAPLTLQPPPHTGKRFSRPFGEYLVPYPTQNMGFVNLQNPATGRSMYLGAHDPEARFRCFCFQEVGTGPDSDVCAGLIHYPFVAPDETFVGAPLVVRFHAGDWVSAGRTIYRPWFIRQFGLMKPADDWIRRESFYQMIMIMLPEGNVNYICRQIPDLARDGLKYGIRSLQIAGWQCGGHDNGYPYYEPDPRLGTWGDLREAVRQCHEMGVKVYFFVNIHVQNVDTVWYRRELKDYDFEMVSGHPAWLAGWGMGTLASRMGLTTPLMTFADPSFPGLAEPQLAYFRRLAEIGADGIHIDKNFPSAINLNPRVVMSPDRSPWEGTIRLIERIARECRAIHPDFRISSETNWDRFLSFGAATWWAGNMSVARRVFPELAETVGLYQPYDYIGVNDAVRQGWVVMVSPFHFNRSMDCEPWRGLAGYIRDVKRIRDELADDVFLGEMLEPGEAVFGEEPLPAGLEHAVYRNLDNGRRACVLTNRAAAPLSATLKAFGDRRGRAVRIWRPGGDPVRADLPATITVESERLVFVVED